MSTDPAILTIRDQLRPLLACVTSSDLCRLVAAWDNAAVTPETQDEHFGELDAMVDVLMIRVDEFRKSGKARWAR